MMAIGLIVFGSGVEQAAAASEPSALSPAGIDSEQPPGTLWPVTLAVAVLTCVVLGLFVGRGWYRLPGLEPSSAGRWLIRRPELGLALFAGLFLAHHLVGIAWIGVAGIPADDDPAADRVRWSAQIYFAVVAAKVLVIASLAVLWRRSGRPPLESARACKIGPAVGIALLAIAATWPVLMLTSELAMSARSVISDEPVEAIAHETLTLLTAGEAGPWRWVLIALVIIAAPLFEEIMYRGGLQSALRGFGLSAWWGIAATSIVFTAMHLAAIEVHAVPTLLVLSLAMGWAYERTGRLIVPIVMHVLFNAANVALALLVSEETVAAVM